MLSVIKYKHPHLPANIKYFYFGFHFKKKKTSKIHEKRE